MEARYVALVILVPFALVFVYATWSEYKRFKTEGRSTYGLSYDPETNTTHVGTIPEDEERFDPHDFDPDLLETEAKARQDDETTNRDDDADDTEDTRHARDIDQPDPDDKQQDTRT